MTSKIMLAMLSTAQSPAKPQGLVNESLLLPLVLMAAVGDEDGRNAARLFSQAPLQALHCMSVMLASLSFF